MASLKGGRIISLITGNSVYQINPDSPHNSDPFSSNNPSQLTQQFVCWFLDDVYVTHDELSALLHTCNPHDSEDSRSGSPIEAPVTDTYSTSPAVDIRKRRNEIGFRHNFTRLPDTDSPTRGGHNYDSKPYSTSTATVPSSSSIKKSYSVDELSSRHPGGSVLSSSRTGPTDPATDPTSDPLNTQSNKSSNNHIVSKIQLYHYILSLFDGGRSVSEVLGRLPPSHFQHSDGLDMVIWLLRYV